MTAQPEGVSKDAIVPVYLRIGDWEQISENLYLDAGAEGEGPEVSRLFDLGIENEIMLHRAEEKDAREYCHANHAATERIAAAIDTALRAAGWDS